MSILSAAGGAAQFHARAPRVQIPEPRGSGVHIAAKISCYQPCFSHRLSGIPFLSESKIFLMARLLFAQWTTRTLLTMKLARLSTRFAR